MTNEEIRKMVDELISANIARHTTRRRSNPYSLDHVDTCLPCYLNDHHNRDGELLLCAMVDGSSRRRHVIDELHSELQSSDRDIDWDAAKLAIDQFAKGVDKRRLFDSSLERNTADCDESCYAYFVLYYPAFVATVDNIGRIGSFGSLQSAKHAIRETIKNSGRADRHGFVELPDGTMIDIK